jgi:hypothetical protein
MNLEMKDFINMRAKIFSLLIFSFFIVACKDGDIPKLQGRYQGIQITGDQKIQVIAQVPNFTLLGYSKNIIFKIYPTLASSQGDQYSIRILDKKTLELKAPQLPAIGVVLSIANNCASGSEENLKVTACWPEGKFDFIVTNNLKPEKSVVIHLVKDDNLPPISINKIYTLDELLGRAKFINYTVAQRAERVLQAKYKIGVARGNLLPSLNILAIIDTVALGNYLEGIGSLLPFLFPTNWYKWKISKEMYQAERNSFASLRGNEMNAVECLYYLLLRDQIVLERLKKHVAWMKQTQLGLQQEEVVGTVPEGTADYFGTSISLIEKDLVNFTALIKVQFSELAQSTSLPPIQGIAGLVSAEFQALENVLPIDPSAFYKEAQNRSYEVKTLNYLFNIAKYSKQEIYFSFIDISNEYNGLGFGTPFQLRVAKSELDKIKSKIDETLSLIELKANLVATEHNQAIQSYRIATSSLRSTEKRLKSMIDRHLQGNGASGEEDYVNQLVDLQNKVLSFTANQATSVQLWLMAKAKINRLLLKGSYADLEAALPDEPKEASKMPHIFRR